MEKKILSRGLRRALRREKAAIRRRSRNEEEERAQIRELLERFQK